MKEVSESPKTQAEILAEIGRQLQNKRQQQELSIEKIADKIHVRAHLLEAIEVGEVKDLPEAIYVREFIKKYAMALDWSYHAASELAASYPLIIPKAFVPHRWKFRPSLRLRPVHLYLLYILLVVVSVKSLGHLLTPTQMSSRLQSTESLALNTPTVKATNTISPAAVKKPTKNVPAKAVKDDKSVMVEVTVRDASWVKIIADGKTVFEGTLPKGSRRNWSAKQKVTVSTGNAGGVLVAFNNGKAQQMGELGQVEEVTYKLKPEI
jgi:cytoskeletal protein RodZ